MALGSIDNIALTPDHSDFDEARRGWNGMIDRRPAIIARCGSVEDVVAAVKHAAEEGLTAVARCGGHSVSGASLPDDGMMIDLSGLKEIEVDADKGIAHVGGGVLLGELDAATQEHGLAVTAGVEPTTGIGGLTLGGGIGFLARKLGLTIDNLLGAQVVLADGSVVEANENDNSDLFWALRGGGGQFGIVTRFDFRLYPLGTEIMAAQAFYPMSRAREVAQFFREYAANASDDTGLVLAFMQVPPMEPFPESRHGDWCIAVVASHAGKQEEEARKALEPLLGLDDLIFGFVDPMPYVEFQKTLGGTAPHHARYYWKSHFLPELEDGAIDLMIDSAPTLPGAYSMMFIEILGGAVGRVEPTESAFANRSSIYNVGISTGWTDPAIDEEAITRTRAVFDGLTPYSDGGVYLNYVDQDEATRTAAAFGPNFERLAEIKKRYDPDNLFGGALGAAS